MSKALAKYRENLLFSCSLKFLCLPQRDGQLERRAVLWQAELLFYFALDPSQSNLPKQFASRVRHVRGRRSKIASVTGLLVSP